MIMSYAAHRRDFGSSVGQAPCKTEEGTKRPGILRRIRDALIETSQRDVDREIARFLAARSARTLTDDLEREISQRLSTSNWSVNASPYGERRFP
jgi:hypothetical protein